MFQGGDDIFYSLRDTLDALDIIASIPDTLRNYIEIGVHHGVSLHVVLSKFPELENVIICDNWQYWQAEKNTIDGARDYIENVVVSAGFPLSKVTFLNGDSASVIPPFIKLSNMIFDLAFVDGDHGAEPCRADIMNVLDNSNIIAVHDTATHSYITDVVMGVYMYHRQDFILVFSEKDAQGTAVLVRREFI